MQARFSQDRTFRASSPFPVDRKGKFLSFPSVEGKVRLTFQGGGSILCSRRMGFFPERGLSAAYLFGEGDRRSVRRFSSGDCNAGFTLQCFSLPGFRGGTVL